MISVIDYDGGNTKSILNALSRCKINFCVTNKEKEISASDKIILPGVSNFSYCMKNLKSLNLDKIIKEQVVEKKKPFLGICSGMQILGTFSEEGNCDGLNLIPGTIKKFPKDKCKIIPHMGWNKIHFKKSELTNGIENYARFYFCHSYYFFLKNQENILMKTNYHIEFCSGVNHKNIYGIQFHPEKSSKYGMDILKNFSKI